MESCWSTAASWFCDVVQMSQEMNEGRAEIPKILKLGKIREVLCAFNLI